MPWQGILVVIFSAEILMSLLLHTLDAGRVTVTELMFIKIGCIILKWHSLGLPYN